MLSKARSFFLQLHEDESAPTTVEWVLLIVVGLLVLVAIVAFVVYVQGRGSEAVSDTQSEMDSIQ